MQFNSIQISNFRSIEELSIDNFKQINLFTGRNNCGKTTILEALIQIAGMSNPQIPVSINNLRNLILASDDGFRALFHNLDLNQKPHISAILDGIKRSLTLSPQYAARNGATINSEKDNVLAGNKTISNDSDLSAINGLLLEFNDGKYDESFSAEISVSQNTIRYSNQYKEKLRCVFHNPQEYNMAMLPQRIENLLVDKQMDGIIEALKEIDPKITDIHIGAAGLVYVDIGLQKLLPINIMGDGIRRILSILAIVYEARNGVLLIDEIENGMHYSTLEILWKALLKALEIYNVQLFVTTHSHECIAALTSLYDTIEKDSVRLYRIERNDNRHRAFEYEPEMIIAGIDSCIEMR